jgi:hypothetical protein
MVGDDLAERRQRARRRAERELASSDESARQDSVDEAGMNRWFIH